MCLASILHCRHPLQLRSGIQSSICGCGSFKKPLEGWSRVCCCSISFLSHFNYYPIYSLSRVTRFEGSAGGNISPRMTTTPGLGRSSDSDLIRVWEQPAISGRSVIDMVRIPSSDPVKIENEFRSRILCRFAVTTSNACNYS